MSGTENGILEELWSIKREIAAEHPSVEAYFKAFMREQSERKRPDYTEWRRDNLFVGETVDSLMDKAGALYGPYYGGNP